ncbi:MAG TPA: uroporphyrinogen decarboxylase [Actinomycetota bacterium]|nr:uroporphyrinogen decarboxylase [Actinomycetota bacterium]
MESTFLAACRRESVDHVPVWFMRQAGRSLPEYRAIREQHEILEICRTPDLAVEVTLQPVRRLGVDAAILFSDIVVPVAAMGVDLEIRPGIGPVIDSPIRAIGDVERLNPLDPEADVPFVLESTRILRRELGSTPLIGFGGAPFTLASYLIEGGPSRNHVRTKALMHGEPATWHKLMDRLSEAVLAYLQAQIAAGASAIQLFDSWVGHLSADDYRAFVLPSVERILTGLEGAGVPRIHFGVGTAHLLEHMAGAGVDVMGIDWRVGIDEARRRLGSEIALQGNLDPALCLAPWDAIEDRVTEILRRGGGIGHIFNLGHGVLPETNPDTLERIVDHVHAWQPGG